MTTILEVENISKQYKAVLALNKVSFRITKGSVYGILGPNGSGKTTLLSIILNVIYPTSGSYRWFDNHNHAEARLKIGSLLEKPNFLPNLNAINNLKMVALIKDIPFSKISDALKKTGLYDRRLSKYKTYSLGMKQRLALAAVLLSDPEVLILDEPTNGLDPQGIVDIRNLIIELSKTGKTILLASHMLDEVEKVCTHFSILKAGKLVYTNEQSYVEKIKMVIEIGAFDMEALGAYLLNLFEPSDLIRMDSHFVLTVDSDYDAGLLNKRLIDNKIIVNHLRKREQSLETSFLNATGGDL